MRLVTDLVDLNVATLTVRELQFPENALEAVFPTETKETVEYKLGSTDRFNEATVVRAFDASTPLIGGGEAVEIKGGLPAVSAGLVITETDAIRARRLAGVVGAEELTDSITGAMAKTTKAVQNKYELMRGLALAEHRIVLDENGIKQSVEFDVPAANLVTRALAWSDPAADIIGELFAWAELFSDSAGEAAAQIITTRQVRSWMLRNEGVRQFYAGSGRLTPSVITPQGLNEVLDAFELPAIGVYERLIDTGQRDANRKPIRQRVLPQGKLVMLPTEPIGSTQMGLTEHAVSLAEKGILTQETAPGMVALTFVNEEPLYKAAYTQSIGLPVIDRADAIVTATVN